MKKPSQTEFPPRGLSRVQAAYYVGVSTSLFDEMVVDGRMPKPREINRRRVWDRQQVDMAFDMLPGGSEELALSINYDQPNDSVRSEPAPLRKATDEEMHRVYMEALGYDPRGMTEEEHAAAEAKRIEEWTADVLASPLWKRERHALTTLLTTAEEWFPGMHLKGASGSTMERLEARGYVVTQMRPWHYLDTGKLAPHECEYYKLTPEGEKAAQGLVE
jgi:predicted DNA-binding transcriptional regulator AlpA